jgi:parvulin-like peptidyl-prolyl isomerase
MNKQKNAARVATVLAAIGFAGAALGQSATQAPAAPAAPALYATVNDRPITQAEFHASFSNYLRQKFFHGQIPADQVIAARKEVEDQVVNRLLLLEEIDRRGIQPDVQEVERQVAVYEQRYANNPAWEKSKETVLPGLREQLKLQSRLARLDQTVRQVKVPGEDEAKAFHASRQDLFTEPEKLRIRIILLAVDPSAPRQAWDAAASEAASIVKRIRAGADFGEQARLSSNDATAENGGDMGYIHRGMLPDVAHQKIDEVKLGEVTDPIESLQGQVILKLEDRTSPMVQPYDKVAERARDLLLRERKDKAWADFLAGLRAAAKIVILAPLGAAGGTAAVPASAPAK